VFIKSRNILWLTFVSLENVLLQYLTTVSKSHTTLTLSVIFRTLCSFIYFYIFHVQPLVLPHSSSLGNMGAKIFILNSSCWNGHALDIWFFSFSLLLLLLLLFLYQIFLTVYKLVFLIILSNIFDCIQVTFSCL
jgi:hypothetical protein